MMVVDALANGLGMVGTIAGATLVVLAIVGAIGALASRDRDRVRSRLARVAQAETDTPGALRRAGFTDEFLARIGRFPTRPLLSRRQRSTYLQRLQRAGLQPDRVLPVVVAVKIGLVLPAMAAAGGLVFLAGLTQNAAVVGGAAIAAGLLASQIPDVYIDRRARSRQNGIEAHLPDALDLLIVSAEAGQTLDAAMARVGREIHHVDVGLGDELARTAAELRVLPDRTQALHALSERNDAAGLRSVVGTLVQGQRQGTPLAHSLRAIADELRDRRMAHIEEKAARLPALITIPLIFLILPAFFVVMVGPAIIQITDVLSGF